ncbi:hypothetical protein HBI56_119570 [Parastagonospora nodorum]|nr:hypothetical protein HBH51_121140 [Parastagonospora nodorum]KAH4037440.1 hypothetical protein HBI09_070600 [Parastagonospora nodorum]KAH4107526.1 hypothetical protein HBH46_049690 [Parastagonospora nodorum]KAH4119579.1 hypothetical protein HBH47_124230 [Parastagonospora nodorum]KAH4176151.1 hypothetical protein HBH43_054430 [Parastagonospora nodorum]
MAAYEIIERDEAGIETGRYVSSGKGSRVDVVKPAERKSYVQQVFDVFLPAGYPQSVSGDYIQYQIYDSLQAFSSSIAGMLASRAVLEGVGVGDSSASPTAALLLSVLQESMGRIATILFAHRLGTALEPECKMYRLAADVFNDTAMILDCLSPAFPKPFRVLVLSFSSVLRSLCGVCAGSAKASLSAHFARKGNLGEVNAKDSSQETVISLLGMLAGSVVVSWVSTPITTWSVLIALLSIHLATNYAAVKAVSMRCLNRQRANIVFGNLMHHGSVLTPTEVSQRERIFERDGVLRWVDDCVIGHCTIGVPLGVLLASMSQRYRRTGSLELSDINLPDLMDIFADQKYVLWFTDSEYEAIVVLKEGCTPIDQLKAWAHALLFAQDLRNPVRRPKDGDTSPRLRRADALRRTIGEADKLFAKYTALLRQEGWDLDVAALETRAGVRSQIGVDQGS